MNFILSDKSDNIQNARCLGRTSHTVAPVELLAMVRTRAVEARMAGDGLVKVLGMRVRPMRRNGRRLAALLSIGVLAAAGLSSTVAGSRADAVTGNYAWAWGA